MPIKHLSPDSLDAAIGCGEQRAKFWAGPLWEAMLCWGIDTDIRQAAFLAQVAHESGSLTTLEENLNYSAAGLRAVFRKYFTAEDAELFSRQPERIANRVYANRMGNGDEASGDGWRFRGRGLIQVTGRDNYDRCGRALGVDLVAAPHMLLVTEYAAQSAAWYWKSRSLNALADAGDTEAITRAINGGTNGLAHRLKLYERTKLVFGIS